MGLSIHYNGRLRDPASLSEMIEEVKDIAEFNKWEYFILKEQFPDDAFTKNSYNQDVYGICISPPKCETISLSFLSNGRMSDLPHLKNFGNSDDKKYQEYLYMLSAKTQYAGIEIHKFIIHLFHYLDKKYFQDFKMMDEGEYWETGDEKLLQEIFKRYNDLMDNFSFALENIPMNAGETYEIYFERIMKQIHNKKNK